MNRNQPTTWIIALITLIALSLSACRGLNDFPFGERPPDIPPPTEAPSTVAPSTEEPATEAPPTEESATEAPPTDSGPAAEVTHFIHDIQGNVDTQDFAGAHNDTSPLDGITATVQGIVVGDFQGRDQLEGFFLQEEDADADADPGTSEGIFIHCDTDWCTDVNVGDLVTVTGEADEFFGMTQLDDGSDDFSVTVDGTADLPSPAIINLPVVGDIDDFYEQYEGMLVTFPDTLTVSEYFQLARFGQVILYQGGRPMQYTHYDDTPTAEEYTAHLDDLDRRRVILDDDDNINNGPLPDGLIYLPQPGGFSTGVQGVDFFRGGDTINGLVGVLHWSFAGSDGTDAWRVRTVDPELTPEFEVKNPRSETPPDPGGSLTVVSLNLLNYFTTIDEGASICGPSGNIGCRGADSVDEFEQQAAKTVAALAAMNADIIGLSELENNGTAIADLTNRLNAAMGAGTYDYIDTGIIGTDAIAVGIIYKPGTVTLAGDVAVLDDQSFTNPLNAGTPRNRPSVAQTFTEIATGESFTVVVNHLKSKGSSCGLSDDDRTSGQGNCNGARTAAALTLLDWIATDPTDTLGNLGAIDPDVLLVGDMNAYAGEDPIAALRGGGYTDLLGGPSTTNYSYLFDGQTGYLDYAMSSSSLTPQIAGAAVWWINADEVPVFDYNNYVDDGGGEESYHAEPTGNPLNTSDPFRISDHDPVVVGLNLGG